ncbi:hypothetical protein DPMN_053666 [Dreissena polymorpha]|uniref:Uncharacterized protein n=1 Tax=Dreissena polymorpha TaxID=45954 RepID=A0A9D4HSE9_DREPO|nr:hypothetical protein DPMN_053666 [Dreissena polymorpha]
MEDAESSREQVSSEVTWLALKLSKDSSVRLLPANYSKVGLLLAKSSVCSCLIDSMGRESIHFPSK